ncbi:MAG: thrombospondin type 3 repeat-containing protein [bacterium]|nr:thrombospondin type 3 repeat-containing protein [bacterium]
MKYFFALSLLTASFLGGVPAHAKTYVHDLGIQTVTFSKTELFAGEKVRVYAKIVNYGTSDEVAYVNFWQGGISIGNSQPASLRAEGFPEEVFVDFTVPDQAFNIRVVVNGDSAGDENPKNNEKVTALITPIPDKDHDKIADSKDNCPDVANADQKNTDGDSQGDACDNDDDNDGLSDSEEKKKGTNPLKSDTDGDGVNDADDVFPTDPTRSQNPPPAPPAAPPAITPPSEPEIKPSPVSTAPSEQKQISPITAESAEQPLETIVLETVPITEEIPAPAPKTPVIPAQEDPEPAPTSSFDFGPYVKGLVAVLFLAAGGLLIAERSIAKKSATLPEPPQPMDPMPIAAGGKKLAAKPKKRKKAKVKKIVESDDQVGGL